VGASAHPCAARAWIAGVVPRIGSLSKPHPPSPSRSKKVGALDKPGARASQEIGEGCRDRQFTEAPTLHFTLEGIHPNATSRRHVGWVLQHIHVQRAHGLQALSPESDHIQSRTHHHRRGRKRWVRWTSPALVQVKKSVRAVETGNSPKHPPYISRIHPNATSRTIITVKPIIAPAVAKWPFPPCWASGMTSSTTTKIIAPAANASA